MVVQAFAPCTQVTERKADLLVSSRMDHRSGYFLMSL